MLLGLCKNAVKSVWECRTLDVIHIEYGFHSFGLAWGWKPKPIRSVHINDEKNEWNVKTSRQREHRTGIGMLKRQPSRGWGRRKIASIFCSFIFTICESRWLIFMRHRRAENPQLSSFKGLLPISPRKCDKNYYYIRPFRRSAVLPFCHSSRGVRDRKSTHKISFSATRSHSVCIEKEIQFHDVAERSLAMHLLHIRNISEPVQSNLSALNWVSSLRNSTVEKERNFMKENNNHNNNNNRTIRVRSYKNVMPFMYYSGIRYKISSYIFVLMKCNSGSWQLVQLPYRLLCDYTNEPYTSVHTRWKALQPFVWRLRYECMWVNARAAVVPIRVHMSDARVRTHARSRIHPWFRSTNEKKLFFFMSEVKERKIRIYFQRPNNNTTI